MRIYYEKGDLVSLPAWVRRHPAGTARVVGRITIFSEPAAVIEVTFIDMQGQEQRGYFRTEDLKPRGPL